MQKAEEDVNEVERLGLGLGLGSGATELQIKTGRWCGLRRDEQICKMCDEREVEDVEPFLLHCNSMAEKRKEMVRVMNEIMEGWERDGR